MDRGFGRARRFRNYGQGSGQVDLPPTVQQVYQDFSMGYMSAVAREMVPGSASPYITDMEVTAKNRLVRLPGTTAEEALTGKSPEQMWLQAALENRSEVILIDAPFVGVKSEADTVWTDEGLDDSRPYGWTNYGGTLVFSNGVEKSYYRNAGGIVTASETIPPARAFASNAARLLCGGATIDGRYEPLGVAWSTAADLQDFEGIGAGNELLINDMSIGDRIVSMRSMGLDFVAVLMRNSIWLGSRTGLVDRPWDWQPRVAGTGTVNDAVVQVTRFGVVFLSDTGVYLFDGNQVSLLSKNIDGDLLPLNVNNLGNYSSAYDPRKGWYYLFTPTVTWIYDLAHQRWYRSSMIAKAGVPFAEQFHALTWGELTGTWSEQEGTWSDYSAEQSDDTIMLFLGSTAGVPTLAMQDPASELYFEAAFSPTYDSPLQQNEFRNHLVTFRLINIEYTGQGTVDFYLPDNNSEWNLAVEEQLENIPVLRMISIPVIHTGKGFGIRLVNLTGRMEIVSVQLTGFSRGARIEKFPFYPREYHPDFGS